jgi:hypothetical protein
MVDSPSGQGRWAFRPIPPEPRSIAALIRDGTLDAELAATLWVLIEARVPVVVAAAARSVGKTTLLRALLDFVPSAINIVELLGVEETFDWLPQASDLGWHGTARRVAAGPPVRPDNTILLAAELSDHTPAYIWGDAARVVVRAAAIGYGLAATIHGDSLDDVFATLAARPVRRPDQRGVRRIVAAHYVRPVVRDEHGHVQRLGPAVLATWDPADQTFEHFGWGVIPELAMRVGRRPGDFEIDVDARRALLEGLVASGATDVVAVRGAIQRYLAGAATSASGERPPATPS